MCTYVYIPLNEAMENLRNKCRVCLSVEDTVPLISWNFPVEDIKESLSYAQCFQNCTQLNLILNKNNGNNQYIRIYEHFCFSCAAKLKEAYLFIRMARETDAALRISNRKFDTSNKCFEWVGIEKESDLMDIKEQNTEEDLLNFANDVLHDEHPNPQDYVINFSEESSCDSNKLIVTKQSIYKNIRNTTQRKNKKEDIKESKGEKRDEQVICRACDKSITKTKMCGHSCKRSIESFLCKSCPRTFRHRSTLTQHELIHENNRERKFDCGVCGRKFYTETAKRNHLKTHDPTRKPRFHCSDCGQSFLFKGNLIVHQLKHAGQTIPCKYCQKSYVRIQDLEVHIRSHTGDTPFKCDMCEKAFTKRSTLRKHLKLHEGIQWKCEDCGKEYLYEWTLQRHRLEHTGLPLRCSICDKKFPEMYKIRRHIKGVHKVNLHEIENFVVRLKAKKERVNVSQHCSDTDRKTNVNK